MNPLNIYIVRGLNAQPSQQNTLVVLMTVPWSFKLVYGFLSDVCPIGGLRRKPYLAFGYLLSSLCYLALVLTPEVLWAGFVYVFRERVPKQKVGEVASRRVRHSLPGTPQKKSRP